MPADPVPRSIGGLDQQRIRALAVRFRHDRELKKGRGAGRVRTPHDAREELPIFGIDYFESPFPALAILVRGWCMPVFQPPCP